MRPTAPSWLRRSVGRGWLASGILAGLLAGLLAGFAAAPVAARPDRVALRAAPVSAETPFTFAVLSDVHVGRTGDTERFREAVALIRRLQPAPGLVVVSGDLTDGGTEAQIAEYKKIIGTLAMPVFDVQGNHDVGFRPSLASEERWRRRTGMARTPFVLTIAGRHFVAFDSQWMNSRRPPPAGPQDPGFDELDRLEALLASLPPGPVFLVHHIPPVPNWARAKLRPTWHAPFLRRFGEILDRHPVTAQLCGHFHRDQLHFVRGAPLLLTPSTSSKYDFVGSVRLLTHDERGLRLRQIFFGPRGRGRSYVTDLRGLDADGWRQQVTRMPDEEVQHLWLRRYTNVAHSAVPPRPLTVDQMRAMMLADPTEPDAWTSALTQAIETTAP